MVGPPTVNPEIVPFPVILDEPGGCPLASRPDDRTDILPAGPPRPLVPRRRGGENTRTPAPEPTGRPGGLRRDPVMPPPPSDADRTAPLPPESETRPYLPADP